MSDAPAEGKERGGSLPFVPSAGASEEYDASVACPWAATPGLPAQYNTCLREYAGTARTTLTDV